MNTILSIWHTSNKGKTETLREFAKLLQINYPLSKIIYPENSKIREKGDFRLVVNINGTIVGIESQGDPKTNLKNRLLDLADNYKCEIILCTSRTKGETVKAVDSLSEDRGFQVIWTSTYQISNEEYFHLVNKLKAEHILNLITGLHLLNKRD